MTDAISKLETENTEKTSNTSNTGPEGHRARLRERFLKGGMTALADYELLELILFSAIPRKDVKPLAKDLIHRFGSFAGVITASPEKLSQVKGISDTTAVTLKAIQAGALLLSQQQILNQPIISNWQALIDYCHAAMAHETKEQFRILFLDKKNRLIADEVQQTGTIDHTPVYPREVIKRALELDSTAIILAHNHPSGDPSPSQADIDMTSEIVKAGQALGVQVHDHLIIAKNDHTSFRNMGLL